MRRSSIDTDGFFQILRGNSPGDTLGGPLMMYSTSRRCPATGRWGQLLC